MDNQTAKFEYSTLKQAYIDDIRKLMEETILYCQEVDRIAKELDITNEQYFLDWQDKLNEISVR